MGAATALWWWLLPLGPLIGNHSPCLFAITTNTTKAVLTHCNPRSQQFGFRAETAMLAIRGSSGTLGIGWRGSPHMYIVR